MGDGPDGLLVSQSRQQPAKRHFENASFDLDRRLRSLIQQAPHGAVTLGRARALRPPALSWFPGHTPTHEDSAFSDRNAAALGPTSAIICSAESTPKPGTSATRFTTS